MCLVTDVVFNLSPKLKDNRLPSSVSLGELRTTHHMRSQIWRFTLTKEGVALAYNLSKPSSVGRDIP